MSTQNNTDTQPYTLVVFCCCCLFSFFFFCETEFTQNKPAKKHAFLFVCLFEVLLLLFSVRVHTAEQLDKPTTTRFIVCLLLLLLFYVRVHTEQQTHNYTLFGFLPPATICCISCDSSHKATTTTIRCICSCDSSHTTTATIRCISCDSSHTTTTRNYCMGLSQVSFRCLVSVSRLLPIFLIISSFSSVLSLFCSVDFFPLLNLFDS